MLGEYARVRDAEVKPFTFHIPVLTTAEWLPALRSLHQLERPLAPTQQEAWRNPKVVLSGGFRSESNCRLSRT